MSHTLLPLDKIQLILPWDAPARMIVAYLIARADKDTGEFYYTSNEVAERFDKDINRARRKMRKIRNATSKKAIFTATIKGTNTGTYGKWENYNDLVTNDMRSVGKK